MYRVHHNYDPDKRDEHTDIVLRIGDIVTNVEYLDNGWSIGYNVSRENAGIFPRRNIYPVQEDISSIFPPARPKNRPIYLEERIEDYVQSDEIVNWWRVVDREALKQAYYQVVHTDRHQHRILKGFVGFIAGIILGVLAYIGLQFALEYPPTAAAVIASVIGFILVIGLSFSTKCRAVVCLCIPTLTTRSGRLMFSTFAAALLLTGPMTNITNNASQLASVSNCAGALLSNQTQFLRELAKEPYDEIIDGINKTVQQVEKSLNVITSIVQPLSKLLDELDSLRQQINQQLRLAKIECEDGLDDATRECEIKMDEAAAKCREYVTLAIDSFQCAAVNSNTNRFECTSNAQAAAKAPCNDLLDVSLCNPVTTVKASCNGLSLGVNITNYGGVVQKVRDALSTDIAIKKTIGGSVTSNTSTADVVASVKEELEQKTKVVTDIFMYVNWVLSLSVLVVVVQAYIYLRKYMMDDKHDNMYITDGFVIVDEKRCKKGKTSLLPLAPKEKKLVTDKRQCRMSIAEKKSLCVGLFPVLLGALSSAVVVGFDFLLYEAILLSNKYGGFTIRINEDIDVGIDIPQGGLLSTFLNQLIGNLRLTSNIDHTIDFSQCLPNGTSPNYFFVMTGLGVIYLLMLVTVMIQAYGLRLRHTMAGYFYPEREKDRIKFLHRKLLRRRVITIKELKDILMVKRQKKESNAIAEDFFDDLRSMMGCSKYQSECYICEKIPAIEHLNYCPDCNSNFCDECFNITVNKVCPCNPEVSLTYDHVTESDFEDDIQEQIVGQYYAYAENFTTGSHGSDFDEETAMNHQMSNQNMPQRHSAAMFFRQPSLL